MPVPRSSSYVLGLSLLLLLSTQLLLSHELQHRSPQSQPPAQNEDLVAHEKLFVLDEDGEKLVFYGLATGTRLAERRFFDGIAYSRFSEKGDRLFVLTAHQEALVLDVKKILQTSESSASSNQ
jgi:hypothetical protein